MPPIILDKSSATKQSLESIVISLHHVSDKVPTDSALVHAEGENCEQKETMTKVLQSHKTSKSGILSSYDNKISYSPDMEEMSSSSETNGLSGSSGVVDTSYSMESNVTVTGQLELMKHQSPESSTVAQNWKFLNNTLNNGFTMIELPGDMLVTTSHSEEATYSKQIDNNFAQKQSCLSDTEQAKEQADSKPHVHLVSDNWGSTCSVSHTQCTLHSKDASVDMDSDFALNSMESVTCVFQVQELPAISSNVFSTLSDVNEDKMETCELELEQWEFPTSSRLMMPYVTGKGIQVKSNVRQGYQHHFWTETGTVSLQPQQTDSNFSLFDTDTR